MQGTNQSKKTARRVEADFRLIAQTIRQQARAFIMQPSATHINGFDLRRSRGPDGIVVALADHKIVFHELDAL